MDGNASSNHRPTAASSASLGAGLKNTALRGGAPRNEFDEDGSAESAATPAACRSAIAVFSLSEEDSACVKRDGFLNAAERMLQVLETC